MEKTRTENAVLNSVFSIISKLTTVLLSFIVRTVFVRVLTKEYLGLNGLFSNIITMLSLVDLGIGIAIPYSLYKPLAEKDEDKINALMRFYRKVYNVIGILVLVIGLSITPFLNLFIKEMPDIPHINIIYILFVLNSVASYFFIYKQSLIQSDQKSYIVTKISIIVAIIKSIVEMIVLLVFKNYILYLSISIIATIAQNIIISWKCNKMYPYIKKKSNAVIKREEIKDMIKNIKSLFIYRIAMVIVNGTDNVIISKMIGLVEVGLYSNYLMVINAVNSIISQVFSSITASIGNFIVTKKRDASEKLFHNINFCSFYIYGICSICLITLLNPFIEWWLGSDYLLPFATTFVLGLNVYVLGMQNVAVSFRTAYGLFWEARYRPIATVIVNIVTSVILAKWIGITGVFVGTFICRITTTTIFDPLVLYKHGFKKSSKEFFKKYVIYMLVFLVTTAICIAATFLINGNNIWTLIVKGIVVFVIANICFILFSRKKEEFTYFLDKIKELFQKMTKRWRKSV